MVAPADLPIPRARWPAFLPIQITTYHLPDVLASSARIDASRAPSALAVSNPKVGIPAGRGKSLSIVFGTWATLRSYPIYSAISETFIAPKAVSSPPMVTR